MSTNTQMLFIPGMRGAVGPVGPVGPQGPIGLSSPNWGTFLYNDTVPGNKTDVVELTYNNNILAAQQINTNKVGVWNWLALISGGNDNAIVATDCLDNSYVLGTFNNPCVFRNANNSPNGSVAFSYPLPPVANGFVGKIDKYGKWLWVSLIKTTDFAIEAIDIKTDGDNNAYISIDTQSTYVLFVNSDGTNRFAKSVGGNQGTILAKINDDGVWQWGSTIHRHCSTVSNTYLYTYCNNDLIVNGTYNGIVDFYGPADNLQLSSEHSQSDDVFAARIDTNGNWIWLTRVVGSLQEYSAHIVTDCNDNSYIVGSYESTSITFYNANGSEAATLYNTCIFVGKLSPNGYWIGIAHIEGNGNEYASAVNIDSKRNIYLTAQYGDSITLYNFDGSTTITLPEPPNSNDGLVAKLDVNGVWVWACNVSWQSGGFVDINNITIDTQDGIYVVGSYGNVITFYNSDTSPGLNLNDPPAGTRIFIAKIGSDGFWISVAKIEGQVYNQSIDVDTHSNIYTAGTYGANYISLYNTDGNIGIQRSNINPGIYIAKLQSTTMGTIGFLKGNATYGHNVDIAFPGGVILENTFNNLVPGFSYYVDCNCQLSTCNKCSSQKLGLAITTNKLLSGV